jgi:ElaA protein
MIIETKTFENLSNLELYKILKLRQDVFMLEQNCLFPDIDGLDLKANHCFIKIENEIVAYTRIFDLSSIYEGYLCIGRVVSDSAFRTSGYGRKIMEYSIKSIYENYGHYPIKIGAQAYLENFYSSFGFKTTGEPYLEDDIWHIHMVLDQH